MNELLRLANESALCDIIYSLMYLYNLQDIELAEVTQKFPSFTYGNEELFNSR